MKKGLFSAIALVLFLLFLLSLALQVNPVSSDGPPPKPPPLEPEQAQKDQGNEVPVKVSVEFEKSTATEEKNDADAGPFPPVWASYREEIGFKRYQKEMSERGAVFFFYNGDKRQWEKIDFGRNMTMPFDVKQVGKRYGARPSQIEKEPAIAAQISESAEHISKVFLARPIELERKLESQLQKALANAGINRSEVLGFRGHYEFKRGRFLLCITGVSLRGRGLAELHATVQL